MNQIAIIANSSKTMTSREIAELVESRHDSVKLCVDRLVAKGVISRPPMVDGNKAANGIIESVYQIGKRDSYIIVAQLSPEFTARLVDRWQALEDGAAPALPDFANPAAAARAWADALDAKNEALAIASRATTTKAEIGNRREATAMNTASQAVKKAAALEIELDRSKQYASVKRMEMLYHGQKFEWRKLKSGGQEMGIETIEIFDANYGTVKAYHADVWREVYALSIDAAEGVTA